PTFSAPPAPTPASAASGVIQYGTAPRFSASPNFRVSVNGVPILVEDKFGPAESPVLDSSAEDFRLAIARLAFDFNRTATANVEVDIAGSGQNIFTHTISPQNPSVFGRTGEADFYTNVRQNGSKLSFTLRTHKHMLLKVNDLHYLMLFIDVPEQNPPRVGQTNVISLATYLSPGRDPNADVTAAFQRALDDVSALGGPGVLFVPDGLYMTGQLVLKSNTHLYLSSGAMIQSLPYWNRSLFPEQTGGDSSLIFIGDNAVTMQNLQQTKVRNVKITGRGYIDGNGWRMRYNNDSLASTANVKLFRSANAENVHIEGVYWRESARWSFNPILTSNLVFRDVKLINNLVGSYDDELGTAGFHVPYVTNTDGFDIDTSTNVLVEGSFVFTADDAFTPKTSGYMDLLGTCSGLVFRNNTMFTEKVSLKIGTETLDDIFDVTFEQNHIIRGDRLLSILSERNNGVSLRNIRVLNNRIEEIGGNSKQRFFQLRMLRSGSIDNVLIDGLDALHHQQLFSSSEGFDAANRITNVVVRNFRIAGALTSFDDVFKWVRDDNAYVDFTYSEWDYQGERKVGGAPVD
ncbi:MAG: hypothetical protein KDD69_09485, partial [Bdellovibrionales bacterium]|nr:hypothetical protein [Bdellovibrionales bacterium]